MSNQNIAERMCLVVVGVGICVDGGSGGDKEDDDDVEHEKFYRIQESNEIGWQYCVCGILRT